jgi:hypothetical protein
MSFNIVEGIVRVSDDNGNLVTSQDNGSQRALDIGVTVEGNQIDPRQIRQITTSDEITVQQGGIWDINNISGTVSLPTGASTAANQITTNSKLDTLHIDITTTQPRKLQDGSGNVITSQISGSQRALDIGVNVGGVQVDPRQIRALISSDIITANQGGVWNITNISGEVSLPTGAATSANQLTTHAKLDTVNSNLTTIDSDIKASQPRKLQDGNGNIVTSTIVGSTRSLDVNISASADSGVWIRDGINASFKAKVDGSGNLYMVTPTPEAPAGKTSIVDTKQGDVTGTSDSFTIIPSGFAITIQRLKAGSEVDTVAGSKVELHYAPNGTTVGTILIDAVYVNGDSDHSDLNYITEIGNGTKAILLRRQRLGGGAVEIFGKWEGYY